MFLGGGNGAGPRQWRALLANDRSKPSEYQEVRFVAYAAVLVCFRRNLRCSIRYENQGKLGKLDLPGLAVHQRLARCAHLFVQMILAVFKGTIRQQLETQISEIVDHTINNESAQFLQGRGFG